MAAGALPRGHLRSQRQIFLYLSSILLWDTLKMRAYRRISLVTKFFSRVRMEGYLFSLFSTPIEFTLIIGTEPSLYFSPLSMCRSSFCLITGIQFLLIKQRLQNNLYSINYTNKYNMWRWKLRCL